MKKRILSLILAFAMAATLAPATALVGSSTAKAAIEVSAPKINMVAADVKVGDSDAKRTKDLSAPTTGTSEINVTVQQGSKNNVVYLNSDIDWDFASKKNDAGTATNHRYVKFTKLASDSTAGTKAGLNDFTFVAMDKDGNDISGAANDDDYAASVAKLVFDVPKTTQPTKAGEPIVIRYLGKVVDGDSPANEIGDVDLDNDLVTNNNDAEDVFTIKVNVVGPSSDWATLKIGSTSNGDDLSKGGIVNSKTSKTGSDGNEVKVYFTQNIDTTVYTTGLTGVQSANPFAAADLKTVITAEDSNYGKVSDGTKTGAQSNIDSIKIYVLDGAPNGIYYFNAEQKLGETVVNSARFGIRVGLGARITLDPNGGAIYDAEFKKDGNVYIGEFGKVNNLFTTNTKELPTPIREDKIFDGWYVDGQNTVTYPINTTVKSEQIFTARWKDTLDNDIKLESGGGRGSVTSPAVKLGDKLANKSNPLERSGYTLLGWSVRPNANVAMYGIMDEVTVNMIKTIKAANNGNTLYAVWKAKTFTISFDPGIPAGEKLSDYSATSMDPITWSTDKTMLPGAWETATKCKFRVEGYKFLGWARDLGGGQSANLESNIVWNVRDKKEFRSNGQIDIEDLQNMSGNNITLKAAWQANVATYVTLKEETGNELNDIHDVNTYAPVLAGRVGYYVEQWSEGTKSWLPEHAANATVVPEANAVLTPTFRKQGIRYNMILATTKASDYALDNQASAKTASNIGERQADSHLVTFSADEGTVLLPDRSVSSEVATFVGYHAYVANNAGGVTSGSDESDVSGWKKLAGTFKGSFSAKDIIEAIEATNVTHNATTYKNNAVDGVVFFYPVWKYNLKDARLVYNNNVNGQNIVVNYGTSLATIQNMLDARFDVTMGGVKREITRPDVSAGITLSGNYNPIVPGTYNLKATIRPSDAVITNSASFTKDVVVRVLDKTVSGFSAEGVVATGFTAIDDINLEAGANIQDILAHLSQIYRVEVLGDNGEKYMLELAEVNGAVATLNNANADSIEWKWGNAGQTVINYSNPVVALTANQKANETFDTRYKANNTKDTFTNATITFALPVDSALKIKNATETGRQAGTLEYVGANMTAGNGASITVCGNKYVLVNVNVGAGSKDILPTPAEPEKEEVNPDRPAIAAGPVYVLYNKANQDHYYTASKDQRDALVAMGLQADPVAFYTPSSTDANAKPVYTLYNPNSGEHFYTMSKGERNKLVNVDKWQYHGVQFYAYSAKSSLGSPVYRLWNPNAVNAGSHYFAANKGVYNKVASWGWSKEGVAFRAVKAN